MVQAAGDVVQLPMPDGTFVSISDVLANSGAVFISDGSANGDLVSANGFGGVCQVTLDLDAIHAHIDLPFLGADYSTAVYVSILHEFVHIHTGWPSTTENEIYIDSIVLPAVQQLIESAGSNEAGGGEC